MSLIISSGQTSSGLTVTGGNTDTVLNGGSALVFTVQNGARFYVSSGGFASGTDILNNGVETVYTGGTDLGAILSSGGTQNVFGVVSGATVLSYGGTQYYAEQHVLSGGTVINDVISAGGTAYIYLRGAELGGINAGSAIISGDSLASGVTVSGGGVQTLLSGGTGSATNISSGGTEIISSGGTEIGAVVRYGDGAAHQGLLIVSSGGLLSGATDSPTSDGHFGGQIQILSGGTEKGDNLQYGYETVSSGGTASGTTITAQGTLYVDGGLALGADVAATFGAIDVSSGGTMSGGTAVNGGVDYIYSGGTAVAETVSAGGEERVRGGVTSGTGVQAGGVQSVESSGAVATSTTISSGGTQIVSSGASNVSARISAGGTQVVSAAGVTRNDAISGVQTLSGGTAFNDVVGAGGLQTISSGGVASAGTILSGGSLVVSSGGTAAGDVVSSGGSQTVLSGGTETGEAISGGTVILANGAAGSGTAAFTGSGGLLEIGATSGAVGEAVSGFVTGGGAPTLTGNTLDLTGFGAGATVTATAANTLVVSSGGKTLTLTVSGVVAGTPFKATADAAHGGVDIVPNGFIISSGQTSSGLALASGATGIVLSGGSDAATPVSSGATFVVSSGGNASAITVSSGGTELATGSGGKISGGTVLAGGSAVATSGGTIAATAISSGATGFDSAGGTFLAASVASGGTLSVGSGGVEAAVTAAGTVAISSGGTGSGTIVTAGGREIVSSGGTEIAATVGSGGTLSVLSGATAVAATLSGGTEIIPTGAVVSGVTFSGSGGTLVISATSGTLATAISGFVTGSPPTGTGNKIELAGFGAGAIISGTAPNTVTVTSGGTTLTLDVAGVVAGETFVTTPDPAGGIDVTACFLDGTRILTPDGERKVEELAAGDLVMARGRDGRTRARPIRWIGRRSLRATELPVGERHPVRIRAGAFGHAVPHRDLLITPEHCVFVDGRLVPARMLVNGRSIITDCGISAYTVHHLELKEHAILLSEGLKTESWLNTGNRTSFANAATVALHPDFSLNEGSAAWTDAAAPLATDRAFVEPIWNRLCRRADVLGLPPAAPPPALTHDAGLHLVTDRGWTVRASEVLGDRHLFLVPTETSSIRLVSRASRPSDVTGPFVDDRRRLGVLVGEMRLRIGNKRTAPQTAHLTKPALRGWHDVEGGARWTSGDAELPLDASVAGHGPLQLEVQVLCAGPYLADDDNATGSAAVA